MRFFGLFLLFTGFLWLPAQQSLAQQTQQKEAPPAVGKKAADKYFTKRQKSSGGGSPGVKGARYLAIHGGVFIDEDAYKWGNQNDDVGKLNAGVTYRIGEWVNSMDLAFRADFISYQINDDRPFKLSLMPLVTFPDAKSGFPLYFGAGAGVGVFFRQSNDESSLSLDYQIIAGTRFFNVINTMGFSFELGLKNQVFLLSDGQYNGVFAALGLVFDF